MRLVIWSVLLLSGLSAFSDTPKEWTVLLYLNGKNNLEPHAEANIKQIEKFGSSEKVQFVAEWGKLTDNTVKRLLIQKSTDPTKVTSPILENLGAVDMGDYHNLQNFIDWGVKNYPAKHYFLVVWNHGYGWHEDEKADKHDGMQDDISEDDKTGHAITTPQLGLVLAEFAKTINHKVDIFATDACLMASLEVADEVADSAEIFLGSQDIEPFEGWPYHHILTRWFKDLSISNREIAKIVGEEFVDFFVKGVESEKHEVTFSVFDLAEMSGLTKSLKKFVEVTHRMSSDERKVINDLSQKAFRFEFTDYADLGDLMKVYLGANLSPAQNAVFDEVAKAYARVIVYSGGTPFFKSATGGSIWLPKTQKQVKDYREKYHLLKFHATTGWGGFVDTLIP